MTNISKLLIFNGSPRKKGTSYSFARTIRTIVQGSGSDAEIKHIIDYFDGKESLDALRRELAECDVIVLTAPLYVDALPYPAIWFMEKLAQEYSGELKGKSFFAVGQCGFPDITRIEPLLDSCRIFAAETGMKWLGGLAYGGGAIINGTFLEDFRGRGKKITAGFELAIHAVLEGGLIPAKAQETITLKLPKIILPLLAAYLNRNSRKQARENGNVDFARKVYIE